MKASFTLEDMELSGISCRHCRHFKDGKCQNTLISAQEKRKKTQYHACLDPIHELLDKAVDEVKMILRSNRISEAQGRYITAIVERYEGAPKKQVVMDHHLYSPVSKKRKNPNSNFSNYFRKGLGFLTGYMAVTDIALLAKWLTDDGIHSLYDWNPFETSIEKLKKQAFNRIGREMLQKSRRVILDGEAYQILDQENGSLFVVQESPDKQMKGLNGNFVGSDIEKYLNTTWLETHPEVKSRLVHKVRILTPEAVNLYGDMLYTLNKNYWLADVSGSNAMSGMALAVRKGTTEIFMKSPAEKAVIRPAFWIAPDEQMQDAVKRDVSCRIKKQEEDVEKKIAGEFNEKPVMITDNFSVSRLLESFKQNEDMIFRETVGKELALMAGNLSMQLREIYSFSRLDKEDFMFLAEERYGIRTKI